MNETGLAVSGAEDWLSLIDRNKKTEWEDITADQEVFSYNYLLTGSIKKSSIAAGLSPDEGGKYLFNPLVIAFMNHIRDKRKVSDLITKEFLVTQMVNLIPMLSGESPVPIVTAAGENLSACVFKPAELMTVLKELGKTIPEMNVTLPGKSAAGVTVNIDLTKLTGSEGITIEGETI